MEMTATKQRTPSADLGQVAEKLEIQASKLQFTLLSAVDFAFRRFKESNAGQPDELDKIKSEMIVGTVMQAVRAIQAQAKVIRNVARGNVRIQEKEVRM